VRVRTYVIANDAYRPIDGGLLSVNNCCHRPQRTEHDTRGVFVLTFKRSWRFGAHGPILPASFGLRMTNGRRGERVTDLTDVEWRRVESWLDDQSPHEPPGLPPTTKSCPAPRIRSRPPPRAPRNRRC
jgi:hypothetical protein